MSSRQPGQSDRVRALALVICGIVVALPACTSNLAGPGPASGDVLATDSSAAAIDVAVPGDPGVPKDPSGVAVDPGSASPDPGAAGEVPSAEVSAPEGPVLLALDPDFGPAGSVVTVTLHGAGFVDGMEVWFGDQRGMYPFVISDGVANVSTPPSPPGTVPVRVVNPDGRSFEKPAAYRFQSALTLESLEPVFGPESGGTPVTLRGSGFSGSPVFLFGGRAAIGVRVVDDATALVVTPPHAPGRVSIIAVGDGGTVRVPRAFEYLPAPVPVLDGVDVAAIAPASGPAEGGTTVTISGSGFAAGDAVRIGALPATSVSVESAVRIRAVSPPGSPGPADVAVVRGGAGAVLPSGFVYDGGPTRILAVEPENGSWGGGTKVRVYGFGLHDVAHVLFGAVESVQASVVSPVEVVARTPRADAVGPVPVTVFGGGAALGESAFTYFDPTLKGGGTWGGPVDGDLNVTVMSGFTGVGLPNAYVSVGEDVHGVFQGRTDDRGQITFSEFGLAGRGNVHATSEGFSACSVVDVDARNVTLYVYPPPSPEDLVQPPDSGDSDWRCKVSGRIVDYDKYFLRPPWLEGSVYVACRASNYSMYGGSADPGGKAVADEDGRFEVLTGSGEFALTCWMMALEAWGGPAYPLKVGLVRHLKCEYLGPDLEGIEVRLDHDTDAELWLSPGGLPEHPEGLNGPFWYGGWELGTDGFLDVVKNPVKEGARQRFDHQPRPFDADLEGAGYSFYASVSAATGVPYGVALGTGIEPPVEWPLLVGDDAGFQAVPTTLRRSVTAMLPVVEGAILVGDSGGSVYSFDGTNLFLLPNPTHRPIRALVGTSASDWWAFGDRGRAWRFSNGVAATVATGIPTDLLAASGPSPDAFTVAGGDVLADWDGTAFVPAPVPYGVGLRAVRRFASGEVAAAGAGGSFVRGPVGGPFTISWPTGARFDAIDGTSAGDLWIAGERGTLLHVEGDVMTVAVAPGEPDLHGVIVRGPCDVLVFGDRGAIFAYDCNAFQDLSRPDATVDLIAGALLDGRPVLGGRRYAELDGFLPFEMFADPAPAVPWGRTRLAWTPVGSTGVAPSYHQAYLTNDLGMTVWILMTSGATTAIDLPDWNAMIGYDPLVAVGASFLNLTAVAAPGFSIDRYSSTEMGFYRRTAYTANYVAIP